MSDELDLFNFNTDDFDIDFDIAESENRIHKPKYKKPLRDSQIKFKDAKKLASEIDLTVTPRVDCLISGKFIFGDFIEAYIVSNNIKCEKLVISTLSMSQNNVDSLRTLMEKNYVDQLDLIVSDYFFSHERQNLIPYIYEELDIDNKFQLAVARSHVKICFFKTLGGKKIVIHGSANLRSSDNIEQFTIEINESLYDFYDAFHASIIETYKTINKSVPHSEINKIFNT